MFWGQKKLTLTHIEDFYKYSEAAKCSGMSNNENRFGSGIRFQSIRENGKEVYYGIMLYGQTQWAHVSIDKGTVKYQYTKNGDMRAIDDCPITEDKREIALIAKLVLKWYKALGLPGSIEDAINREQKLDTISLVKEIRIDGFDEEFPPVLRVFSDKTTFLILGIYPPQNEKITQWQRDHFEKVLSDATGKTVIHDDREIFVIYDDSEQTINRVVSLLKSFS